MRISRREALSALALLPAMRAVSSGSQSQDMPSQANNTPELWFCPAPGSLDYINLFTNPEAWVEARKLVKVFQMYDMHAFDNPITEVGPNSYAALRQSRAFASFPEGIAMEAGYIKGHNCPNPDRVTRVDLLSRTLRDLIYYMDKVKQAGGRVSHLVIQEPFYSARHDCNWNISEAADMISVFEKEIRKYHAPIQIGHVEAYPATEARTFEILLNTLRSIDAVPDFIHLDIDIADVRNRNLNLGSELEIMARSFQRHQVPWGLVLWGTNSVSPTIYQDQVVDLTLSIKQALRSVSNQPARFIVQSWAGKDGEQRMNPPNLPETREYTHTYLLNWVAKELIMPFR